MAEAFATVQDVTDLFRALTADEQTRTENLLPVVSDILRQYAHKVHKDLDDMIEADTSGALASTAKAVTVSIVARTLNTPVTGDIASLSQYSQSGLGYTVSGTFASGGRTIFGQENMASLHQAIVADCEAETMAQELYYYLGEDSCYILEFSNGLRLYVYENSLNTYNWIRSHIT